MLTRRNILKRLAGAVAVAFTGLVGAVERAKGEPGLTCPVCGKPAALKRFVPAIDLRATPTLPMPVCRDFCGIDLTEYAEATEGGGFILHRIPPEGPVEFPPFAAHVPPMSDDDFNELAAFEGRPYYIRSFIKDQPC